MIKLFLAAICAAPALAMDHGANHGTESDSIWFSIQKNRNKQETKLQNEVAEKLARIVAMKKELTSMVNRERDLIRELQEKKPKEIFVNVVRKRKDGFFVAIYDHSKVIAIIDDTGAIKKSGSMYLALKLVEYKTLEFRDSAGKEINWPVYTTSDKSYKKYRKWLSSEEAKELILNIEAIQKQIEIGKAALTSANKEIGELTRGVYEN